jgi:hypothetical protein
MTFQSVLLAVALAASAAAGTAQAQQDLFAPVANREAFLTPGPLLTQVAADPANAGIELVAARAELVSEQQRSLRLTLTGGIKVEVERSGFERMESGNEIWYGKLGNVYSPSPLLTRLTPLDDALEGLIIVRSNDTLMGTLRIGGELYRLMPVDNGLHALIEVDQSAFPPDEDEAAYAEMLANVGTLGKFEEQEPLVAAKAISTIRILVAFGPAAAAVIGNEQQAIDLAFAESNAALAATNTDIRIQQAGVIRYFTQSETTNYSTMLSRLSNLSDGFYDAIGGQRNSSAADMVAYVAPVNSGLCGQARGIATSNANAYFVMSPNCLSGNYTFVHEAAHVVGARHDNDPTLSPYAYGHGYVITSRNRRTVMAVNNGPCSSCTRIGAFSTPNYTLGGVPIGTASRNDNTRVWRTRGPTVASFR